MTDKKYIKLREKYYEHIVSLKPTNSGDEYLGYIENKFKYVTHKEIIKLIDELEELSFFHFSSPNYKINWIKTKRRTGTFYKEKK